MSLYAVVRYDGPLFYLATRRQELAFTSFKSIYKVSDDKCFRRMIADFEKTSKMTNSTKVSLKDAFIKDENFVRAGWVNVINIIFHEVAGINVII